MGYNSVVTIVIINNNYTVQYYHCIVYLKGAERVELNSSHHKKVL